MSSMEEKKAHAQRSQKEVRRRDTMSASDRQAHENEIRSRILPHVKDLTGQWSDSAELAKELNEKTGRSDITEGDIYSCLLKI
jgi:hypothetical protein